MQRVLDIFKGIGIALLVLFATYGGFSKPPRFLQWLFDNVPFIKKFLQFVLYSLIVFLTLARDPEKFRQDILISLVSASVIFALFEAIKLIETLYFPSQ